ncbi:tetratricopeptide repeat protein [Thermodesulfobacteriota bacterium]
MKKKTNSTNKHHLFAILAICLSCILIYSNTLNVPFQFDDSLRIQDNLHIRLTSLSIQKIANAAFKKPSHANRPVSNVTFALNYYFHQSNVSGYHVVNILIHIMAGIFLYFFIQITLDINSSPLPERSQRWISFFTALIWIVHPVQTQSVTYIVQRMNSLAAMFYILTLLLYAKARIAETAWIKRTLFAGCMVSGILALGSKEISATIPFFVFLYEWYFFQNLSRSWLKRCLPVFAGAFVLFAAVVLIYIGFHPFESILAGYKTRDFTLTERVLTQFRVVIFYISLLMFPHPSRLNLNHDFPLSHSIFDPASTFVSAFLIIGLICLAICTAKKERLFSFSVLWFLGNLVVESSVIALEIIFEHRIYLPSMFVFLMVIIFAFRYIKPKWLLFTILCGVMVICALWTYKRNHVWQDNLTLWADALSKNPHSYRAHNNFGKALSEQGRSEEAIRHFSEALRIKPDLEKAHNNMGNALNKQGRPEEAIDHYLQALRINPDYAKSHYNLGKTLNRQGRTEEAIDHYLQALRINPYYADVYNNMGNILSKQGRTQEAIDHYLQALRIKPDFEEAQNNLGVALFRKGDIEGAIKHFREALRIKPDYIHTKNNLKKALMYQRQNQ